MARQIGPALERLTKLHPKLIDLSLSRMVRVCKNLNDPQENMPPTIHVAGTNGKGSTIAHLRAMFEAAGKHVHVYTSPHLVHFRERIRLNGALIDEQHLIDMIEQVELANQGEPLTVFEATTAVAFLAFSQTPADYVILETGLGGRLDATNIIKSPKICLITPIDEDHKDYLGPDIASIAREKAGIIKPHATVICARQPPEALLEIERACLLQKAKLYLLGRDFDVEHSQGRVFFQHDNEGFDLPMPALLGPHQIDNMALAAYGALLLGLDQEAIAHGANKAVWPARLQPITKGPLAEIIGKGEAELILDGAHNPHAFLALKTYLEARQEKTQKPIGMIIGLLKTKDAEAILNIIASIEPRAKKIAFVPVEDTVKSCDPKDLCAIATRLGLECAAYSNAQEALKSLRATVGEGLFVITGSLYLAGQILSLSPETIPR